MWLRKPAFLSTALFAFSSDKITSYWTGEIASDERVIFFPTAAHEWNETHYSVPLHGWVIEPEEHSKKRRMFIKFLSKTLKVTDPEEKEILKRRVCVDIIWCVHIHCDPEHQAYSELSDRYLYFLSGLRY